MPARSMGFRRLAPRGGGASLRYDGAGDSYCDPFLVQSPELGDPRRREGVDRVGGDLLGRRRRRSLGWGWVVASGMKRVTLTQSLHRKQESASYTVCADARVGVGGAARFEATNRTEGRDQQTRQRQLIEPDEQHQDAGHGRNTSPWMTRRHHRAALNADACRSVEVGTRGDALHAGRGRALATLPSPRGLVRRRAG